MSERCNWCTKELNATELGDGWAACTQCVLWPKPQPSLTQMIDSMTGVVACEQLAMYVLQHKEKLVMEQAMNAYLSQEIQVSVSGLNQTINGALDQLGLSEDEEFNIVKAMEIVVKNLITSNNIGDIIELPTNIKQSGQDGSVTSGDGEGAVEAEGVVVSTDESK